MNAQAVREEARQALRVYQSRTGLSLLEIATRAGFAYHSVRQFASGGRYGDGNGESTGKALLEFFRTHPFLAHENPGRLYETDTTRKIDKLISYCQAGGWGILYGPTGAQKSHLLKLRAAEAESAPEPSLALVEVSGPMTPWALFGRIAREVGAPYAQSFEGLRNSILYTVRSRKTPLALVLDEADLLYKSVDALEVLRRLGDALPVKSGRPGLGLLVAGNEDILRLFEPRRGNYFGRWRDRIEQKEVRVLGPSQSEAREIVRAELGEGLPEQVVNQPVESSTVKDPVSGKQYVSTHRLFHALEAFRRKRGVN